MPYVGKIPLVGDFKVVDNISVVNNQAAYNMQVAGVNVIPESSNNIICSLNGVIQKPGSSFTVSGSTITFSQNLVTGDVIDFIQILGSVLDIGTPSDATVTTAKLGDNAVTTAKMFSGFKNGITMADQWRLTADTNSGTNADVTSNWERNDSSGYSSIGTGLTENSGIFSFPSTGIYLILFTGSFTVAGEDTFVQFLLNTTLDNSNYTSVSEVSSGNDAVGAAIQNGSAQFIFDVTNTSNDKFKFTTANFSTGTLLRGDTSVNETHFTVIRLGDT
jgi:hypothetical protein